MRTDLALAADLWRNYGRHAERMFAHGPTPSAVIGDRSFFAASGGDHVDLNQAVLYGAATAADATLIAGLAVEAGVPVLLGCSASVGEAATVPLADAGFRHLPEAEHLFWMPGVPAVASTPFVVRRIENEADMAALQAMFVEVHDYDLAFTEAMYGATIRAGDDVTGWIAWDDDEAVSLAFVTHVGSSLGLWEVMTPTRHRRRGAARAVVANALDKVARSSAQPIQRSLFWSSPAGRPLYEALGFTVADTVSAWALGASQADLAAVGAG